MDLIGQWNLQPQIKLFNEKLWYAQWTSHKPCHLVIIFGNHCCVPYPDRPIKMSFSYSCRSILCSCRHDCVVHFGFSLCKTWVAWTKGGGVRSLCLVACVCCPMVFAWNLFLLFHWYEQVAVGAEQEMGMQQFLLQCLILCDCGRSKLIQMRCSSGIGLL